jgi:hypothetical protein
MLIVYGIGIPLYGFVNLFHRRKKLDSEQCRQVYGFMYVRKCARTPSFELLRARFITYVIL